MIAEIKCMIWYDVCVSIVFPDKCLERVFNFLKSQKQKTIFIVCKNINELALLGPHLDKFLCLMNACFVLVRNL